MSKPKYEPGEYIDSWTAFHVAMEEGRWLYWHGIPKHPSILRNQQYHVLDRLIREKRLRLAELRKPGGDSPSLNPNQIERRDQ